MSSEVRWGTSNGTVCCGGRGGWRRTGVGQNGLRLCAMQLLVCWRWPISDGQGGRGTAQDSAPKAFCYAPPPGGAHFPRQRLHLCPTLAWPRPGRRARPSWLCPRPSSCRHVAGGACGGQDAAVRCASLWVARVAVITRVGPCSAGCVGRSLEPPRLMPVWYH